MGKSVKTGDSIRLLDNLIWKEYKAQKPPKKFLFNNREELKVVVKEICNQIALGLLEKKAGVLLKGFGYFFNWKIPKKMTYSFFRKGGQVEDKYNHYTGMYMYSPSFLPAKKFIGWDMDKSFNKTYKKSLKEKLLSGFEYKMYPHSFKNILEDE